MERTMKRGKGWREIVVGERMWMWKVGRSGGVVARSTCGRRRVAQAHEVKGVSPDVFERGQHKRTPDGTIFPCEVARWLGTVTV